ncbi:tRNA (guanine(6)-N2)-methyltransferase THUMP3 [Spea bombifrons]|uniref:tRNA (guanine(6)-N2)-methyltransferase THUMP3 n=1 Tax=Spea bombifrons TaxID=233779 RepID=UPI002349447F|nr:tRNA (guanine(6)-N2)-methyltransferase THUMP3 [Spea bombifrons]
MSEVDSLTDNLAEVKLDVAPNNLMNLDDAPITIGATVPTGFEFTAAAEVEEKLGCPCRISKDRGKIYFDIRKDSLAQVHRLKSVDNLFVIVEEFKDFPFKESKEDALRDFQELAPKLSWDSALSTWELNNSLKKKKKHKKKRNKPGNNNHNKERKQPSASCDAEILKEDNGTNADTQTEALSSVETHGSDGSDGQSQLSTLESMESLAKEVTEKKDIPEYLPDKSTGETPKKESLGEPVKIHGSQLSSHDGSKDTQDGTQDFSEAGGHLESEEKPEADEGNGSTEARGILKFRVTCNRAGDKHSFTSNDAARDFGGAVQDHFQWKADMTKFDIEVLLNISYNEMVVGIALTEESLHRRNITHFGPTTLRSTLAYGMLRLCDLQPSDVIIDPMCGTGAIPIEGVSEWPSSFFIAGDNNPQAVNRTASNISSLLEKQQSPDCEPRGLPIDAAHWDISSLPLRTGSVDVIVTDMPFGKRIGSKKKNWDLYPSCLREMSRVCRAGTGRAVLLTHDRKCFIKALAKAGHLWKKMHTVWVNIGGLHAGVYLLKRTSLDLSECSGERPDQNRPECSESIPKEE